MEMQIHDRIDDSATSSLRGDHPMNRGARTAFAILSFGAYVIGLLLAGVSGFLAMAIGPFDGFAATMIVVPGAIGLAGGAGIVRVAG